MFFKHLLLKFYIFLLITTIPITVCFGETNGTSKTEVVIIGTIHQLHYEIPAYGPDVLEGIIYNLKPAAILNELPLSLVDSDGRPVKKLRVKRLNGGPECWAADSVAQQLAIKQIPYDRPDRNDFYKRTNYFMRQKKNLIELDNWFKKFYAKEPDSLEIKSFLSIMNAISAQGALRGQKLITPVIINSDFYDSVIKIKHSKHKIFPQILKKHNASKSLIEECIFFNDEWEERNKIMADNILKAANNYKGKRIVVITGSEHRYILRELLNNEDGLTLKEFWELLPEYKK